MLKSAWMCLFYMKIALFSFCNAVKKQGMSEQPEYPPGVLYRTNDDVGLSVVVYDFIMHVWPEASS